MAVNLSGNLSSGRPGCCLFMFNIVTKPGVNMSYLLTIVISLCEYITAIIYHPALSYYTISPLFFLDEIDFRPRFDFLTFTVPCELSKMK